MQLAKIFQIFWILILDTLYNLLYNMMGQYQMLCKQSGNKKHLYVLFLNCFKCFSRLLIGVKKLINDNVQTKLYILLVITPPSNLFYYTEAFSHKLCMPCIFLTLFSLSAYTLGLQGSAGAEPSCEGARGGTHPGSVASLSSSIALQHSAAEWHWLTPTF